MPLMLRNLLLAFVVYSLLLAGFSTIFVPHVMDIAIHEICAISIVAVVLAHVYLMRSFFKLVLQQRAPFFVYRNFTLLGIVISLVAALLSGVCISYYLFQGLIEVDRHVAHLFHNAATSYLLLFIGLHLGCYASKFFAWLDNSIMSSTVRANWLTKFPSTIIKLGLLVVAYHGALQVCRVDYFDKLTLQQSFSIVDYDSPMASLIINNLAILGFYFMLSASVSYVLLVLSTKKESKARTKNAIA